jgi:hypothetical protein
VQEQSLGGKITDLGSLQPERKFCKDCKHSVEVGPFYMDVYGCGIRVVRDPVDGKQRYAPCATMRSATGVRGFPTCGPDGLLWESKNSGGA